MATKHPRRAFQHILDNIADIRRFTKGLDKEAFEANDLVIAAVERCLSRLSEAAVRLDDLAPAVAPGPEWGEIRGLGNRLRHFYDTINLDIIWGIATGNLDQLEAACTQALKTLPPDP